MICLENYDEGVGALVHQDYAGYFGGSPGLHLQFEVLPAMSRGFVRGTRMCISEKGYQGEQVLYRTQLILFWLL